MPRNAKWERVEAALKGAPVDRVPFTVWTHFPRIDHDARALADATVDLYRHYDQDVVKVMFRSSWGSKTGERPTTAINSPGATTSRNIT